MIQGNGQSLNLRPYLALSSSIGVKLYSLKEDSKEQQESCESWSGKWEELFTEVLYTRGTILVLSDTIHLCTKLKYQKMVKLSWLTECE